MVNLSKTEITRGAQLNCKWIESLSQYFKLKFSTIVTNNEISLSRRGRRRACVAFNQNDVLIEPENPTNERAEEKCESSLFVPNEISAE